MQKDELIPDDKDAFVADSQHASADNEKLGETPIETYQQAVPDGEAHEDIAEISSTDDV